MPPMMRAAVLLFLILVITTARVAAQAPTSVFLDDLTWTEVRDATAAGKTMVIVPIGGTEQSGPHMALGKHNVRAKVLAGKIAAALGNALVGPVLAYVPEGRSSPPTAHMRFPGTITVTEDTFEATLQSVGRGFRLHGFKDIVFIGDHGGYQKAMARAAAALNKEWAGTSVRAHAIEAYYRAAAVDFPKLLHDKGFKDEEIGTHAGLADTSLMLAIAPALVRADRLQPSGNSKVDGVSGDPRRSSAELGKLGVDLIVDRSVEAIRRAASRK
jgi:creatinine amidohydrolase/Fe(II)-dependent formamide hydrolase-like protein